MRVLKYYVEIKVLIQGGKLYSYELNFLDELIIKIIFIICSENGYNGI